MAKLNLTQIYRKSLRCFIAKYYVFCYNRIINFCFGGPRDGCFIQQTLEIVDRQEDEQGRTDRPCRANFGASYDRRERQQTCEVARSSDDETHHPVRKTHIQQQP